MRRKLQMGLLALGVVGGYGAGFASLSCHRARRASFEEHVARVCVDAARRAVPSAKGETAPPPNWE